MNAIDPTAIIDPTAVVGEGTTIGPYSIIGPKVVLGRRNVIGPHVVLTGNTKLGDENTVYQFASVGSAPQDLKYRGEDSTLVIGSKNIVREYATLQPGTEGGGGKTVVGDENLFMVSSHVGHDSIVGNQNIFANGTAISGHCVVGNRVTVGGLCGVHQFVRLGDFSFLGAGAMVSLDIPPYCMAQGDRAALVGLNDVGLERAGIPMDEIAALRKVYRGLFLSREGKFRERLEVLLSSEGLGEHASRFLQFIKMSERGVATLRRGRE